jgi:hypothetical protein
VRIIDGLDRTSVFGHDAQGNLTSVQRPREAAYGETADPLEMRRYNALNQLTRIEDAQHGAAKPTVLGPDARDQLASVQAANWTPLRRRRWCCCEPAHAVAVLCRVTAAQVNDAIGSCSGPRVIARPAAPA